MTISTVKTILNRVNVADETSKIAVFKTVTEDGIKALDSMFYTSTAIKKEKLEPENFVGAYHMHCNKIKMLAELNSANR